VLAFKTQILKEIPDVTVTSEEHFVSSEEY